MTFIGYLLTYIFLSYSLKLFVTKMENVCLGHPALLKYKKCYKSKSRLKHSIYSGVTELSTILRYSVFIPIQLTLLSFI